MKKYKISDIIPYLGENYELIGKIDYLFFDSIKPVFESDENSLTWINSGRKDKQSLFDNCKSKIVICDKSINISLADNKEKCIIIVNDARLVFTKILNNLFVNNNIFYQEGIIHPTSVIHPGAKIHHSVTIGPFNVVGKCEIGEYSFVGANNVIHDNVIIGSRVRINEFNLLGGAGLGFVRDEDKSLVKMAHIGRLIIEDDVEVFTHVNIDRGTLSETRVKKGTKIDHHVNLGHNTIVGEHSQVVAHSVLCGGSSVGDRTWVGVGSYIKDSVKVGNDVTLGLGAVVTKNVPDGETWAGNPAQKLDELISQQKKIKAL